MQRWRRYWGTAGRALESRDDPQCNNTLSKSASLLLFNQYIFPEIFFPSLRKAFLQMVQSDDVRKINEHMSFIWILKSIIVYQESYAYFISFYSYFITSSTHSKTIRIEILHLNLNTSNIFEIRLSWISHIPIRILKLKYYTCLIFIMLLLCH